jgi:hypothetical protein
MILIMPTKYDIDEIYLFLLFFIINFISTSTSLHYILFNENY